MRFTINSVIKKVTSDLDEKFGFNTSIASLMELINEMYKYKELDGRNSAVIKEGSVIKKVTSDLDEKFGFNTSIASLMELINEMYKYKELDGRNSAVIKEGVEAIVTIIAPFTPHLGEELWQMIGKEGSVFDISWPEYDEKALVKDEVEVVVQINGKVRKLA